MSETQTPNAAPGSHAEIPARLVCDPASAYRPGPADRLFSRAATRISENEPSAVRQAADRLPLSAGHATLKPAEADNSAEYEKTYPRRPPAETPASDATARREFESLRWPEGPICPRCRGKNVIRLKGAAAALGQLNCRTCRRKFTVTVGTPLHGSTLPIGTWTQAIDLIGKAPRRYSPGRLRRDLDDSVSYQTAKRMRRSIPRKNKSNRSHL